MPHKYFQNIFWHSPAGIHSILRYFSPKWSPHLLALSLTWTRVYHSFVEHISRSLVWCRLSVGNSNMIYIFKLGGLQYLCSEKKSDSMTRSPDSSFRMYRFCGSDSFNVIRPIGMKKFVDNEKNRLPKLNRLVLVSHRPNHDQVIHLRSIFEGHERFGISQKFGSKYHMLQGSNLHHHHFLLRQFSPKIHCIHIGMLSTRMSIFCYQY